MQGCRKWKEWSVISESMNEVPIRCFSWIINGFKAEFKLKEGRDDHSCPIPPIAFP